MPRKKPKSLKKDCPLLIQCKKAFGIDCQGRNFLECDFYKNLLREKVLQNSLKTQKIIEERKIEISSGWEKFIRDYNERRKKDG